MTGRKSSFCNFGNCVEVEFLANGNGNVEVGSSKAPDFALVFTPDEWRAFIAGVRNGEFDLPLERS